MITKTDCLLLLSQIPNSQDMSKKVMSEGITPEIIKYINDARPLDIILFYEKMRKSYNAGHSVLYGNIVKERTEGIDIITTLCSLQLQVSLFSKKTDDAQSFLKHARFDEISYCIYNYAKSYDLTSAQNLLRLIKADLKCLESVSR